MQKKTYSWFLIFWVCFFQDLVVPDVMEMQTVSGSWYFGSGFLWGAGQVIELCVSAGRSDPVLFLQLLESSHCRHPPPAGWPLTADHWILARLVIWPSTWLQPMMASFYESLLECDWLRCRHSIIHLFLNLLINLLNMFVPFFLHEVSLNS